MLHKDEGTRVPGLRVAAVRNAGGLIAALATFAVSPAFGAFTCEGKVTYLGMNFEGLVTVSVGDFGGWYIRNQPTSPRSVVGRIRIAAPNHMNSMD